MQIVQQIRDYIAKNLLFSDSGFSFSDDASFLGEGIVDSVGVLELVTFVGQEFGVTVEPDEMTPDNFDSVSKIEQYVRRKQAGGK
jgi:acyl carrier protein